MKTKAVRGDRALMGGRYERRDQEWWIDRFKKLDAFWTIGNKRGLRPHVILSSGLHSDGLINCRKVIPHFELMQLAVHDLLDSAVLSGLRLEEIEGVVGPKTGATKIAEYLAIHITALTGRACFFASPSKDDAGGKRKMVFTLEERLKIKGKTVLLCEDVITTGASVVRTGEAVTNDGGKYYPRVVSMANRLEGDYVEGLEIVSLINYPMNTWLADQCPLCKKGSRAISVPKDEENWEVLMGGRASRVRR